ncbi:MAG: hypothetical protein WD035_11655 [Balneolaceae bacterium]
MNKIKDLIYFDRDKAISIYSQLNKGVVREFTENKVNEASKKRRFNFNILNLFKPSFEKSKGESYGELKTKELHHDLLNSIENSLNELDSLFEITQNIKENENFDKIRKSITESPFIAVDGWTVFEDYKRLDNIANKFNDLNLFINRCALSETEVPEELIKLESELSSQKKTD